MYSLTLQNMISNFTRASVYDDGCVIFQLTAGLSGGYSGGDEPVGEQADQPAANNEEGEKAPKVQRSRRDNKRKRKDKRVREMEKVSFHWC